MMTHRESAFFTSEVSPSDGLQSVARTMTTGGSNKTERGRSGA